MDQLVFFGLGPFAMMSAGCGLLWLPRLGREYWRADTDHSLWIAVRVAGWVSLLLGMGFAVLLATSYLAILGIGALVLVLLLARRKHREAESQSLLWCLSTAAERGYSMESAARAFASERRGAISDRAEVLAEYLELGVRLSLALRRSNNPLPGEAILAADMGQHTGELAEGLRSITEQRDAFELTFESMLETLFYFAFVAIAGLLVTSFLMLKIFPTLLKLYDEFQLEPPGPTQLLLGFSQVTAGSGVLVPVVGLLAWCMFLVLLYFGGMSLRWMPGVNSLWWRADCAMVMRWLAIAVKQQRSIAETTRLLSGYCVTPQLRRRLAEAARRMEKGTHWCDSLRRANLIRSSESSLFKSAERAGNLEWALGAMAESTVRRSAYRMRALLNVAFPIVTLLIGVLVLFIAAGTLSILFDLIRGLS